MMSLSGPDITHFATHNSVMNEEEDLDIGSETADISSNSNKRHRQDDGDFEGSALVNIDERDGTTDIKQPSPQALGKRLKIADPITNTNNKTINHNMSLGEDSSEVGMASLINEQERMIDIEEEGEDKETASRVNFHLFQEKKQGTQQVSSNNLVPLESQSTKTGEEDELVEVDDEIDATISETKNATSNFVQTNHQLQPSSRGWKDLEANILLKVLQSTTSSDSLHLILNFHDIYHMMTVCRNWNQILNGDISEFWRLGSIRTWHCQDRKIIREISSFFNLSWFNWKSIEKAKRSIKKLPRNYCSCSQETINKLENQVQDKLRSLPQLVQQQKHQERVSVLRNVTSEVEDKLNLINRLNHVIKTTTSTITSIMMMRMYIRNHLFFSYQSIGSGLLICSIVTYDGNLIHIISLNGNIYYGNDDNSMKEESLLCSHDRFNDVAISDLFTTVFGGDSKSYNFRDDTFFDFLWNDCIHGGNGGIEYKVRRKIMMSDDKKDNNSSNIITEEEDQDIEIL